MCLYTLNVMFREVFVIEYVIYNITLSFNVTVSHLIK